LNIVGPFNIKTPIDLILSYCGPLRNDMLKKIDNINVDNTFNQKILSLYHIDAILLPLLIGECANNPRVKQAEAD
jgi:hypothetical protein